VTLLRLINEAQKGTDRIDCFLDAADADGEVRIGDQDRRFSLQERGAEPPERWSMTWM
jgi:hypothetical protein